jgi:hypothetical protein
MKRFTDIKKPLKRIFEQTEVPVRSEDPNFSQMPKLEEEKSVPAKFFSKIFESREMAHMFHLKTQGEGSFAQHLALQDYYQGDDDGEGGILPLIDDLVEVYQGQYDLVEGWDNIDKQSKISEDPIQYFIEVAEFVKRTRYSAISEEDAHIQAIIDEILIVIYKLIYKLRFLK